MSSRKRRPAEKAARVPPGGTAVAAGVDEAPRPRAGGMPWWAVAVAIVASLFLAFEVYGPSLNGEFLFDDDYLPFMSPEVQNGPLRAWLGVRPLLMLSYWLNYQNRGLEPFTYHAFGVMLHAFNAVLAWLIVRRLLGRVGELGRVREVLSGFAGGLFLLHPVMTESVAYVSSRSETMSVFFFLSAYLVFIHRKEDQVSWVRLAVVLVLFAAASSVKEHTAVLPALLLLTDYFFTTPFRFEAIRRNLRFYLPVFLGGALALAAVWRVLATAQTAGFKVQEFTWYQYLFTQFRVIWTYVRLYLLPIGLNGDYTFPVSRTPIEHGAILWFVGLAAVSVAAWIYRREFPLAAFGWFGFLLLLAPTSSVVPIRDVIAERRLYLPFFCLLLITVDFLRRWRPGPGVLAGVLSLVLVVSAFGTHQRSRVWSSAVAFWSDTVEKSPDNSRAVFQLAYAQWKQGDCTRAAENYQRVAALEKPDDRLLVDWALALDCLDRPDEAVAKLREAAAIAPSALIHTQIGMIYGKRKRLDEALAELDLAEKLDPRFEMTYVYRGNIHVARGDFQTALHLYRHALSINPKNETARTSLTRLQQGLAQQ